jgi:protein-disulfide isomerase
VARRLTRLAFPAFLAATAVVAVAIVVIGLRSNGASAAAASTDTRPVEGSATAPVTIVEYSDYQCDYCGRWARTVQPQLTTDYVDTGKVRFEWHDMAWEGDESKDAANAARCAGDQGKYWPYHDLLYQSQGPVNSGAFSKDHLKAFGAKLGLDTATFDGCIDGDTHAAAVAADFAEAGRLGIDGTPAFFVNGQRIDGAQPFSAFQAAIDAALATASPH